MASKVLFRLPHLKSSKQIGTCWVRSLHLDQKAPLCKCELPPYKGCYAKGIPVGKSGQRFFSGISSSPRAATCQILHGQNSTLFGQNNLFKQNIKPLEWTECISVKNIRQFSSSSTELSNILDKRKVQQGTPLLFSPPSPLFIPDQVFNFQVRGYGSHLPERHREVIYAQRSRRGKHNGSAGAGDKKPEEQGQKQGEQALATGDAGQTPEEKLTLYQRFKKTYKEHGKVLIAVHLVTSAVWFGSFYTAARCGIDIVPYLESWNFSEKIIKPFRAGGLGDVALAYLMYKLATPARYTVTIGGTNLAIRYLQKEGHMKRVPHEDTLRSLYKEGKEDLKKRSKSRIRKLRLARRRHLRHKHRPHHPDDKHH